MNTLTLYTTADPRALLIPEGAGKNVRSRLGLFADWLTETGRTWSTPDLAAYRDHLLTTRKPSSVGAYLSTVRGRYRDLLKEDATRNALYMMAAAELHRTGDDDTPANRGMIVFELEKRLENAIDPGRSKVKVKVVQDAPDSAHLRLTKAQADALLDAPGNVTLLAIRDTAIIALALCTGIREGELVALDVRDLRQRKEGILALHVREGKGCKERMVPYGELDWCLAVVDRWLGLAGIQEGAVFRPLWKDHRLRPGRLTTRAVQKVIGRYEVMIDGKPKTVRPHDLRRTYAKRLYQGGVALKAIQENLGHADLKTTLGYIGDEDFDERKPPAVYGWGWQKWTQEGLQELEGAR